MNTSSTRKTKYLGRYREAGYAELALRGEYDRAVQSAVPAAVSYSEGSVNHE